MGMTITKEIIPTKANLKDNDLSKFWIVKPGEFVYNPRTHGKKIGLGYNNTGRPFIISWNNIAFRVKDINELLPKYLYIIVCREEWDRYACFQSWGSSTEVFSWNEFSLMEIPLPDIKIQQELVDVYNGLKALAEQNEALIEPLNNACEAFIVNCMKKYNSVKLYEYIELCDERNKNNIYNDKNLKGVTNEGIFEDSRANIMGLNFSNYKIVKKGEFTYNPSRINLGSIALNNDRNYIVSQMYCNFRIKRNKINILLPEFLNIWFRRKEFQRSTLFYATGSVRDTFDFELMCNVTIPLPPIEVQKSIINIYQCLEEAKRIAFEAREKLKTLCPALVQRAANT